MDFKKDSNNSIISAMKELAEINGLNGEVYKERAYNKAISELKKCDVEITRENLATIHTILGRVGRAILDKIREFVTTGQIKDLVNLKNTKEYRAYIELGKIAGVGPATIRAWMRQKIYSFADLRRAVAKGKVRLNNMQKYGLKYYDDLNTRIPRAEVTTLSEHIRAMLIQIDPNVICTVCGSYRRGFVDSGDIDILVSNKTHFFDDLLPFLIDVLNDDKNFIDVLSAGRERLTFLYKSPISGKVRQIDVLNLPYGSYYAGVLYFTGDYEFNENMRGFARLRGYRLNQTGLFKIERSKIKGVKTERLNLIPSNSEEEIFSALGLKYIPPNARNGSARFEKI
jgi:DNA polymerase/3'-5' exonuclease PolX